MEVLINGIWYIPAPDQSAAAGDQSGKVPPINGAPTPYADLGAGEGSNPPDKQVAPNQTVGVNFTLDGNGGKNLRWYGHPGQFWKRHSWAIFNAFGTKVMGADNEAVVGTLGLAIGADQLAPLGAGQFTAAFTPDSAGVLTVELK